MADLSGRSNRRGLNMQPNSVSSDLLNRRARVLQARTILTMSLADSERLVGRYGIQHQSHKAIRRRIGLSTQSGFTCV